MKKTEVRQLLDLIQLLADEDSLPLYERVQLAMDFGYYTCKLEHKIKLKKFDIRKFEVLKNRYWEVRYEKDCSDAAIRQK